MTADAQTASAFEADVPSVEVAAGREVGASERVSAPREPALPAIVSVWCLRAFAPAALAGAVIALVAPFTFVRVLGLVALGAGIAGMVLHAALLRRDHPAAWNRWFASQRARFSRLRARWTPDSSSPSVTGARGAHGFARFAPVMAQEN